MEWHCHVNDPPHVNCSEGIESMEWQEGGGPQENVSVLGPQNVNYGHKDIEMEEEEEEPQLADDDLTIDVFNFCQTFFHLILNRTKSFKHKQHDLVNEQSYTATLRNNVITNPSATLGDIHNQLYLMFHSLLEEIHNVYTSQDLVRVYITHEEMVNTKIMVGPDYLGNITADINMNQIADVMHSNNFVPANGGLIINIAAICNIKGLRHKVTSNVWKDMHQKRCILMVENDDELCLPHCIALAIAHAEHNANCNNRDLCRNYHSMHKKDRRYVNLREMNSLQKRTALKYQSMAGIQMCSPGLLKHIPLYEKALGVSITMISALGGNKRIYQSDPQYHMQIILYHIHSDINDWGHLAVITRINALLGKSYYCSQCEVWPLTTAQVIDVECGVIYVDEMVASWRMHLSQLCAIHAMLLAILLNAWRHTRPKEADRAHPCVTACYSVPIVKSSCAITKKGVWVKQTHVWRMLLFQLQVYIPSQREEAPVLHAIH